MQNPNWKTQQKTLGAKQLREAINYMTDINAMQEIPSFAEAIAHTRGLVDAKEMEADKIFGEIVDTWISERRLDNDKMFTYGDLIGDHDFLVSDILEAAQAVEDHRWDNPVRRS